MRKASLTIAGAVLVAGSLVAQPAAAHDADITILGFQYFYLVAEAPPEAGVAGFLGTPAGPMQLNDGPSVDGVTSIVNLDPVPHTVTQCVADCDTADGVPGDLFDIAVGPGEVVTTVPIPAGQHVFMCTVHPFMRGAIRV